MNLLNVITTAVLLTAPAQVPPMHPLPLPGGEGGVGFDDLLYSRELGKVLVPAGRSGRLNLVVPKTQRVESIQGFSSAGRNSGGHGAGTTSADVGEGLIFASDRGQQSVAMVDAKSEQLIARVKLRAGPDYVRWVPLTREVWVTEPKAKSIEVFKLEKEPSPVLQRVGDISLPDGPESLVIDATRARAYTHSWRGETYVVDVKARKLVGRWPNGCEGSRGIALDESRGFLFVVHDDSKAP